ncbi:hypothetical protein [uncultured Alistipes sp.]
MRFPRRRVCRGCRSCA